MKTKNIILYIIICLIVIAGVAVWQAKGFNTELQYSSRYEITISNHTGIEPSDIEAITAEVLGKTAFSVQKLERFGNAVVVIAKEINEEQKAQIIEKYNEKYQDDKKVEDVELVYIPFTRIKDIIKPFIIPGVATLVLILIYFLIRFKRLNKKEVIIKTILAPVILELLIFSLMAVVRIPFGRGAVALAIGVYIATITALTNMFENQRTKFFEDLEVKKD